MSHETRNLILGGIGATIATLGFGGKLVNVYAENRASQAVIIERVERLADGQEKILRHIENLRKPVR
jgi:hypothetical protein